jgi:SAM-dependent methyltransferase
MSDSGTTLPPGYFDAVYAASADPWQFAASAYEQAKYQATLAALPRPQFDRAFEIGCSIGVLTALLAPRCRELLAVDVSALALATTRRRLHDQPQVEVQKMVVPRQFPAGTFDLIVLSEVGYYWSLDDLAAAAQRILQALRPAGALVLVHWTPPVHDHPLTGDAVHDLFKDLSGQGRPLRVLSESRHATYRMDVFARTDACGV